MKQISKKPKPLTEQKEDRLRTARVDGAVSGLRMTFNHLEGDVSGMAARCERIAADSGDRITDKEKKLLLVIATACRNFRKELGDIDTIITGVEKKMVTWQRIHPAEQVSLV